MNRALFLSLCLLAPPSVLAATEYWVTAGSGAYDDVINWTSAIPTGADDVVFDQDLAYTVTLSGTVNRRVATLSLTRGDLTLDMAGKGLWIDSGAGFDLAVGNAAGETASLTLKRGGFHVDPYWANNTWGVGTVAGASGTLNITGSSAIFYGPINNLSYGYVGTSGGIGNLYIGEGGRLQTTTPMHVGDSSGENVSAGTVIVDGVGSTLEVDSELYLGGESVGAFTGGTGGLVVRNGGHADIYRLISRNGNVDVSGAGSTLDIAFTTAAGGRLDGGTINVFDSGQLTVNPDPGIYLSITEQVNVFDGGLVQARESSVSGELNIGSGEVRNYVRSTYGSRTGRISFGSGGQVSLSTGELHAATIACGFCDYFGPISTRQAFVMDSGVLTATDFRGQLINWGGILDTVNPDNDERRTFVTRVDDYVQEAAAALRIYFELQDGGAVAHTYVDVSRAAFLDGLLEINDADVFDLSSAGLNDGDTFTILEAEEVHGQFAAIANRCISETLRWDLIYDLSTNNVDTVQLRATEVTAPETCEQDWLLVQSDVDPWSDADIVQPTSTSTIALAALGSSAAAGDPIDFDVTQIDPASLSLGRGSAPNIGAAPLYGDYDADGNTDAAFVFQTQATGILCLDGRAELTGMTLSGMSFKSQATFNTADCSPARYPVSGILAVVADNDIAYLLPQLPLSDDYRAAVPGNQRFWLNLLGTGTTVYVDESAGSSATRLHDFYNAQPGITSTRHASEITAAALSGVDLLVLHIGFQQLSPYSVDEHAVIRDFIAAGGNVVVDAETNNIATYFDSYDALLAGLGSSIRYNRWEREGTGTVPKFATSIQPTPLTEGIRLLQVTNYSKLNGGLPVVQTHSNVIVPRNRGTVVAYEQLAPLPVRIDTDPWADPNVLRPDSNDLIPAAVLGSSTENGDLSDFDVAQIDPATLKLGPGEAPNVSVSPLYGDYDGDGNTDAAFGFYTQGTGIFCDDTEVTLTGETFSGLPFEGTDTITTTDCETSDCHP